MGLADGEKEFSGTRLGLEPIPSLDRDRGRAEFKPEEIGANEFERAWSAVVSQE